MTTPRTLPRWSIVLVRIAGILFVIAGLLRIAAMLLNQQSDRLSNTGNLLSNDGFGQAIFAGLILLLVDVVLAASFVLLWARNSRWLPQLVFLAIAVGHLTIIAAAVASDSVPDFVRIVGLWLVLAGSIAAAIVVIWRHPFPWITAIAVAVSLVGGAAASTSALLGTDPPQQPPGMYALQYVIGALTILAGVALIVRPRSSGVR